MNFDSGTFTAMSYPGGFPGDPSGESPGSRPDPAPGAFEYPPIDYGTTQPPGPPPEYSPQPGMYPPPPLPPGAYPPPPAGYSPPPGAYQPQPPPGAYYQHPSDYPSAFPNPSATNGLAIGSLVCSLVAIPAYFLCFGFLVSIIGIALGIVALNQLGKNPQKGREMAIAGIIIGGVGLVGMGILTALIRYSVYY
jgi:Domain of unknown function (DUF4190)